MHVFIRSAPLQQTIDDSGTSVLVPPNRFMRTVELTHISGPDLYYCHSGETPEVGKGFVLKTGTQKVYDKDSLPQEGLKAIVAAGQTAVVAVGIA